MAWSFVEPQINVAESTPERIYTDFFNLCGIPFSITPDPEFLYLSDTHQSVYEKLQYGIRGRMGFMVLTGEVGTGKTTLCRALLDHLQNQARTVYVINPSLSGRELLAAILDDLGIDYGEKASKKELIDRLNHFLLCEGSTQPVVIIIDDAQTMPLETLEDLRLLSNLETDKNKLLQILLAGQPELLALIDRPELRQLKQRILIHCHLDFLSREEVSRYIERRLAVAGNKGQVRFSPKAIQRIHILSRGLPRSINKLCDLALTAAYAGDSAMVAACHITAAGKEMAGSISWKSISKGASSTWRGLFQKAAVLFAALLLLTTAALLYRADPKQQTTSPEIQPEATIPRMENHLEPAQ